VMCEVWPGVDLGYFDLQCHAEWRGESGRALAESPFERAQEPRRSSTEAPEQVDLAARSLAWRLGTQVHRSQRSVVRQRKVAATVSTWW